MARCPRQGPRLGVFAVGLSGSWGVAPLLLGLDARLQVAEVDFALQYRADGIEDAGADEAEDGIPEVKADPSGDEQKAEEG